ncbi:membrane-anchored junction protein isoform X3 [Scomber scombrus]|uniref:Membrane-anchored junction protein isoform X3 n=1 Tax=Scomber scombrus TaxID=13677 RepID=A0AAV1PBW3_SCOSC
MSIQAASFPFPETRFFRAGSNIYKFKIRGGSSYSGEEVIDRHSFNQELEEIIRTVLGNLDSLQPFSNTNFIVFPYKKQWEGMSTVMCKHSEVKLRAYPYVLILYLEKNMEKGKQVEENPSQVPCVSEPQPKRRKKDSPLEDAIIQDLLKDMEAENRVSTVRTNQVSTLPGEVQEMCLLGQQRTWRRRRRTTTTTKTMRTTRRRKVMKREKM